MRVHLGNFPRKNNVKRIEKIKIDNWDTVDVSETLSLIIVPLLKKYKEVNSKHGSIPSDLIKEIFSKPFTETEDEYITANKRWNEYLDLMIWSFEEISLGCPKEDEFFKENGKKMIWIKGDDNTSKLIESGYDFDSDGMEEYQKEIQHGLDLFAKYFRDLWI